MKIGKKEISITKKQIIIGGSIFLFAVILFIVIIVSLVQHDQKEEQSLQENKTYQKKEDYTVNVLDTLLANQEKEVTEELETEEIDLEYTTIYQNNPELPKGMIQVLQQGKDGKQVVVTKKIYEGNVFVREEQTGSTVTKAAISKIVQVGTASYSSNYKVKKGDKLYVTSYTLDMMLEPSLESDKVTTLQKDKEVTLLDEKDGWYQVKTVNYTGWVDKQCLTYFTPENKEEYEGSQKEKSKQELLSTLSKNMNLNKPSGLSLDQFKKVLANHPEDENKIFEQNAEYFYYIEQQYNINGIFVAAVGIHESNWGTSKIALDKKNLFGYGASDSSPYSNAYSFSTYAEGIDLIARVFVKYYLNPSGTKIYDNQVASGKYYTGPTLQSVNQRYASDSNWANAVYSYMEELYEAL